MRYTTFRFALVPTSEQARTLARHCGASRFAFNQSLQLVTDALAARKVDLSATVPWSGFDLIKAFNRWKVSEGAGRVFGIDRGLAAYAVAADSDGVESAASTLLNRWFAGMAGYGPVPARSHAPSGVLEAG